ncbi:MAG: hybrid sensor histidine kinase/response regulator [Thermodesulfobacteriota bacterium]
MSEFAQKILNYSLLFLEGDKKSFHKGLDLIKNDSQSKYLYYYKNIIGRNPPEKAELCFFIQSDTAVNSPNGKTLFYDEELVKELSSGKSVLKNEENDKYNVVFIPCFDNKIWKGVLVSFFNPDSPSDIEFLKTVSSLVAKAADSADVFSGFTREESVYKSVMDNIEDGYFETDLKGNLTAFNDAVRKISGLSEDQLKGINSRDYTSKETARNMFRVFNEVYRTKIPLKIKDYEIILKDNTKKWIELSASLITDDLTNPVGFRGLVRDVTARKKREFERKQLEQKLNQAQRLEAVGTLAGGIAHDFNNLLMAVQGNASLIMAVSKGNPAVYEKAKSIEKSVESGAELIKQLLGFARGGKYAARPCNVNRVIDAALVMFSRANKEITIDTDLSKSIYTVEADQSQLEQVLMNLFLNAGRAMGGRGVMSVVSSNRYVNEKTAIAYDSKPGDYVEITVSDTGEGMEKEVAERIFDPFFTTGSKSRGTGLGLASVFGIVKNHKGFITVSSTPGRGSSFKLYFPAFIMPESEKETDNKRSSKPETILLVDDEKSILEVGSAMIAELGYGVKTASGGYEAVALYRKYKNDIGLVVIDMVMPDLDGYKTFNELKKIDNDVKVLFSSGYVEQEQYEQDSAEKGKASGFISKPYNLSVLGEKIESVLKK